MDLLTTRKIWKSQNHRCESKVAELIPQKNHHQNNFVNFPPIQFPSSKYISKSYCQNLNRPFLLFILRQITLPARYYLSGQTGRAQAMGKTNQKRKSLINTPIILIGSCEGPLPSLHSE